MRRNPELLSDALALHDDHDLGLITKKDLLRLTPEEVEVIRIVRQFEKFQTAKLIADSIAAMFATSKAD